MHAGSSFPCLHARVFLACMLELDESMDRVGSFGVSADSSSIASETTLAYCVELTTRECIEASIIVSSSALL